MIRLMRFSEYREMRWKNGQGVTHEVCRTPNRDDYDWRISLATIREAGPFSLFAGYLRNISVLEGRSMTLTIDGVTGAPIPPFQATDFSGNSEVFCSLEGGPLLDFNVIYREGAIQASVTWLNGGEWQHQQGTRVLFNGGAALEVNVDGQTHHLYKYDSLLVDSPASIHVVAGDQTRFAHICLHAIPA